jgi:hypothetical protein
MIPKGCDQQGRYPQAAEAATDLGIEEPDIDPVRVVVEDTLLAMALLAVVGVMVLAAVGALYG